MPEELQPHADTDIEPQADVDIDALVAEELRHLAINCGLYPKTDAEIGEVRATVVDRLALPPESSSEIE